MSTTQETGFKCFNCEQYTLSAWACNTTDAFGVNCPECGYSYCTGESGTSKFPQPFIVTHRDGRQINLTTY